MFLNAPAMQQPEAYIAGAAQLFDEKGSLTNESTREFMQKFLMQYEKWVEKLLPS